MSIVHALEMIDIHKSFGGINALKGVQLKVRKGEVHALMGENGAGKSTLMKILLGVHTPDRGEIRLNGKKVNISNTRDALQLGISMIYQELNPIPHMTVAENIFLGREPLQPITKMVDYKKMNKATRELLDSIQLNIEPTEYVANLSVAQIQLVEIAKAISFQSNIIIMDEPTSAIGESEVENLFRIIEQLKQNGVTVIYISHKMKEIFHICDRVTVLRDGQYIGTDETRNLTMNTLISMMVGREITEIYPKEKADVKSVVMEVKGLTINGLIRDVAFTVREGEILGLAGLMGAGRTEVAEAIFGMRKLDRGEIYIRGTKVKIQGTRDAIRHKIVMVPEDRKNKGLILKLSVKDNIILTILEKIKEGLFLSKKREKQAVDKMMQKLNIKAGSADQTAEDLSGGNQQKIVIAKCLLADPDIIILDEPTRGIDVKTKADIYRLMCNLAQQGKAVIMISSEMPEVLGMSDRIIVLHEGTVAGELRREEATQEKVLSLAMGRGVQDRED